MTTKEKTGKQEIQKSPQAHGLRRFEDLDRLFENFFSRGWLHPFHFERPSLGKTHERSHRYPVGIHLSWPAPTLWIMERTGD